MLAWGRVAAIGVKVSGAGFTVGRIGTGTYRVTFSSEASSQPAVTITPITTAAIVLFTVGAISKTSFEVKIWNWPAGTGENNAFSFLAE